MKAKPWTTDQIALADRLLAEGVKHKDIAARINRSHNAVRKYASRKKTLRQKWWTEEQDSLLLSGDKLADTADILGRTISACGTRRANLKKENPHE